jgi:NTP pyrophosphatase (non-canonical NTP hydrolase)
MYYLYHIPGKKIGVTRNLNTRVTLMQGYKEGEYEVLEQSDDIDFISDREIELQKSYGYKVDRKLYKNLFKKMNINATEQTSTFPCPANKLKGHLMDNIGLSWETLHGKFEINSTTIPWIVHNAKTSMYNNERCYIYNKAYYEAFVAEPAAEVTGATVFDSIRDWADKRGIYDSGDTKTQFVKLMEEVGELGKAILKDDKDEFVDAIGDCIVVLTNLSHLGGFDVEHCISSAYDEISNRTGSMVNGTFVKDAD